MAGEPTESVKLSPASAFALLFLLALCWGLSWPVNKAILAYISPIWAVAVRLWLAAAVCAVICVATGRMQLPPRQDFPMVASLAILHMALFAMLTSVGLQYVSAGRTVLLAYTTPLWVFPLAWLFIGEALTGQRIFAMLCGIAGLMLLVNPMAIAWNDTGVLFGHALILIAAVAWAFSIVYTRLHKWASTPFDLLLWQLLLAAVLSTVTGFILEGWPRITVTPHFLVLWAFGGTATTALAYWALSTINRSLPATTTALGLLAVPLFGVVSSIITLGETFDMATLAALLLIVGGIAIGIVPTGRRSRSGEPSERLSSGPKV
jgi:drug/metabolite transporter (DMT)-like permease